MSNVLPEESSWRPSGSGEAREPGGWITRLPSDEVERILDLFDQARVAGAAPIEATSLILYAAASDIASAVVLGAHADSALAAVGLRPNMVATGPGRLLADLISASAQGGVTSPAHALMKNFHHVHHISFTVLVGGGVNNVPSPECMAAHLPDDRKATPDELQKAWEACSR